MNDWNPEIYLKFNNERLQPSIDLISRINIDNPKAILDIGCGPGNSTQILSKHWPNSHITGIDNSKSMIEKAKNDYPGMEWIIADAALYESKIKYDILFSNAVIQWIPDHEKLLNKFYNMLSCQGILAVQIPLFWDMPLGKAIDKISNDQRWCKAVKGVNKLFTINNYSFYYNVLSNLFKSIEIWETDYMHIMDNHLSILEMIRSTGLKPYLERLNNSSVKKEYENEIFKKIEEDYPLQNNGKVILPFKRLFFIGSR